MADHLKAIEREMRIAQYGIVMRKLLEVGIESGNRKRIRKFKTISKIANEITFFSGTTIQHSS